MKLSSSFVAMMALLCLQACEKPTSNVVVASDAVSSNEVGGNDASTDTRRAPDQDSQPQSNLITQADVPSDPDKPNPDDFAAGLPLRSAIFTPAAIKNFAFGRSKYWIKRTFGVPDGVDESDDSWLFDASNAHMQVEDQEASKRVFVRLNFRPAANGDPQERVFEVEVF